MNKITVEIRQDEDPINPREDAEPMGRMYCWHSRYDLGDKKDKGYAGEDFDREYTDENSLILPLYLYDHSGITISTGDFKHIDGAGWDSGQVGWIVVTNEQIEKEYGKGKDAREKARKYLEGEVKTYDQYLRGDVYYYTVKKTTVCKHCGVAQTGTIDSCGGFYGDDVKTNGMLENISKKYRKQLLEAKME